MNKGICPAFGWSVDAAATPLHVKNRVIEITNVEGTGPSHC